MDGLDHSITDAREWELEESSPLWLMQWPSLIFAPLQKGAVDGWRHPCVSPATAPTGISLCLTVHEDTLNQVSESARPWLCTLVVHSPGKSQVGRVRQPPPTMSQINPWGYIISVNRITGLDMKLCLCSHQCCQFLHCKVGKVTHVGVWRLTDSGGWRTAVAVFLKAHSWAWYM